MLAHSSVGGGGGGGEGGHKKINATLINGSFCYFMQAGRPVKFKLVNYTISALKFLFPDLSQREQVFVCTSKVINIFPPKVGQENPLNT